MSEAREGLLEDKSGELAKKRSAIALSEGLARSLDNFAEALVKERAQSIYARFQNGKLTEEIREALKANEVSDINPERITAAVAGILSAELGEIAGAVQGSADALKREAERLKGGCEVLEQLVSELEKG